jgi:hypothetical protein
MVELRIPEGYERGFFEIRELEDGQISDLLLALESEPPTLGRAGLQTRVAAKAETVPRAELGWITEALLALYALRDSMGLQVSDFADAVCDAMDTSDFEELWFVDAEERAAFKARLVLLLGVQSLDLAARATDLLYEHERTLHGSARVLSDIRPIFGPDPGGQPRGAVIVHTLKISYHEGGRIKEFFVALDSVQVDELVGALMRASAKEESLKSMLAAAGVPHIDEEPGEGDA